MRSISNSQLPYREWPEADRSSWEAAFQAGEFLEEAGAGAHLAAATRADLRAAYGRVLGFLAERHPQLLALTPSVRIDLKIISTYVDQLRQTRQDRSIAIELHHLRLALNLICRGTDWSWLQTTTKRIAARARQKPERHHLVTSERLYALGIELMDR